MIHVTKIHYSLFGKIPHLVWLQVFLGLVTRLVSFELFSVLSGVRILLLFVSCFLLCSSHASGSEREHILSDIGGQSLLDCSSIDLSHDPERNFKDIKSLYNIKQFTSTSSKNNKLSKAQFEVTDPNLYSRCYRQYFSCP